MSEPRVSSATPESAVRNALKQRLEDEDEELRVSWTIGQTADSCAPSKQLMALFIVPPLRQVGNEVIPGVTFHVLLLCCSFQGRRNNCVSRSLVGAWRNPKPGIRQDIHFTQMRQSVTRREKYRWKNNQNVTTMWCHQNHKTTNYVIWYNNKKNENERKMHLTWLEVYFGGFVQGGKVIVKMEM